VQALTERTLRCLKNCPKSQSVPPKFMPCRLLAIQQVHQLCSIPSLFSYTECVHNCDCLKNRRLLGKSDLLNSVCAPPLAGQPLSYNLNFELNEAPRDFVENDVDSIDVMSTGTAHFRYWSQFSFPANRTRPKYAGDFVLFFRSGRFRFQGGCQTWGGRVYERL
jgi:hypothetical protein